MYVRRLRRTQNRYFAKRLSFLREREKQGCNMQWNPGNTDTQGTCRGIRIKRAVRKNVRETCCIGVKTKEVQRGRRVGTTTTAKSQGVKLLGKKKIIKWLQFRGQSGEERRKRNCPLHRGVCRAGFHCSTIRNLATDLALGTSGNTILHYNEYDRMLNAQNYHVFYF